MCLLQTSFGVPMADKLFLCVCYKQVLEFLTFLKIKQVSPRSSEDTAPPPLPKKKLWNIHMAFLEITLKTEIVVVAFVPVGC